MSQQNSPQRFQSVEYFEQAMTKDPSFAPAYAALASVYAHRSIQFALNHPGDELSKIRGAGEKAIQLDPLLAQAHAALGILYAKEARWQEAEKSFRRALELGIHLNYPEMALLRGDPREQLLRRKVGLLGYADH